MIVTIDRVGHLGDGIAPGPAGPVFVPRALPGEVVEGIFDGERLRATRIVTPSAFRVKAPCVHARSCGGCLMQHASDGFVAAWKQGIIAQALDGHGLSAPMRPLDTSPARSRRRATLAGRRTKVGALVGFHARASEILVDIPQCILLHPDIMAALPALHDLVLAGCSRSAELALSVTHAEGGTDVAVSGGKPLDATLRLALARIVEARGLGRLTWNGEAVALRASPVQRFGAVRVMPPPGAFLQATAQGEASLSAAVSEGVGDARRIADLFAGCGTFALPLAARAEVHAVEGDPAMVAALDRAWREAPGLRRVTTEARDLFRRPLDAAELRGFDAVVIDPPRAGAEAQVAALARSAVAVVVHVSCNPLTFAREARTLVQAGFRIDWVLGIDQFRWSSHVELVARFSR